MGDGERERCRKGERERGGKDGWLLSPRTQSRLRSFEGFGRLGLIWPRPDEQGFVITVTGIISHQYKLHKCAPILRIAIPNYREMKKDSRSLNPLFSGREWGSGQITLISSQVHPQKSSGMAGRGFLSSNKVLQRTIHWEIPHLSSLKKSHVSL